MGKLAKFKIELMIKADNAVIEKFIDALCKWDDTIEIVEKTPASCVLSTSYEEDCEDDLDRMIESILRDDLHIEDSENAVWKVIRL